MAAVGRVEVGKYSHVVKVAGEGLEEAVWGLVGREGGLGGGTGLTKSKQEPQTSMKHQQRRYHTGNKAWTG